MKSHGQDTCTIDGCEKKYHAKGMCSMHRERLRRTGETGPGSRRLATPEASFHARVMPITEGSCIVWTSALNHSGYGRLWVNGRMTMAHRYAWERVNGPIPEGVELDHTCWNRSCVNVDHLRLCDRSQNMQNREGPQGDGGSGIRGVSWHKRTGMWHARVTVDGKMHHGGCFTDKDEAAQVAAAMRFQLMTFTQN